DVSDERTYSGVPSLKGLPRHCARMRIDPRNIVGGNGQSVWELDTHHYDVRFPGLSGTFKYDDTWARIPSLQGTAPRWLMPSVTPSLSLVRRSAMMLLIGSGTLSAVNWEPASEGAAADWTFEVKPPFAGGTPTFTIELSPFTGGPTETIVVAVPPRATDGPAVPLVWFENAGVDDDDRAQDFLFHYFALFGDAPPADSVRIRGQNDLILGAGTGCSNSNYP
ncbi:MAG TPA: hypothetical protein VFN10_16530, partial [Thermoanaerobaculia bacterium]|nr:hypothetical protein [Thermoanaerobaculia bacterium]